MFLARGLGVGGGGALNKALYGEALPGGLTLLDTIFERKGTPFVYLP